MARASLRGFLWCCTVCVAGGGPENVSLFIFSLLHSINPARRGDKKTVMTTRTIKVPSLKLCHSLKSFKELNLERKEEGHSLTLRCCRDLHVGRGGDGQAPCSWKRHPLGCAGAGLGCSRRRRLIALAGEVLPECPPPCPALEGSCRRTCE